MAGSNDATTEFVNLLDTNTVDSDQAPIGDFKYNEMDGGVDGHGGEDECEKWELIEKESALKRGSLTTMDDDEDDDGPRNLNKLNGDKKSREKIKREHEASSLRDKIDALVQSNEMMLGKTLEAKKELAEKKT
ncbi:Lactation elevated protein 1 [Hordeum vulgare]|nr:Lactation elevated protein 1 [Hordeum vulgare]